MNIITNYTQVIEDLNINIEAEHLAFANALKEDKPQPNIKGLKKSAKKETNPHSHANMG
jgi:hypothetical protein